MLDKLFGHFSKLTKLFKEKSYLGIDIGTSSIKIVQLSREGDTFKLDNYGDIKFFLNNVPMEMYQQTSLRIPDKQVAELLKKIIAKSKATATMTAISLPVFSSFSTIIDFPVMPKDEMEKAIAFEARQYIPIPINEVSLDFMILGEKQDGAISVNTSSSPEAVAVAKRQKRVEVLLVAIPNEIKSKYQHIASLVGLDLVAIETETFALARSLSGDSNELALIVDIGAHSTDLCVVENRVVRISHNFELSSMDITKAYMDFAHADFIQTEKKKKLTGLHLTPGQLDGAQSLLAVIDDIIHEAQRVMASYTNKTGREVSKIILSGGGAQMPGLLERFKDSIPGEVIMGDPFHAISYPPELSKTLSSIGPSFAVAVGLAMRS